MHTRFQESRTEFSMHHSARLHSIGFCGLPRLRRRRLSILRENDVEQHRQGIGTGTASVIKSESYFLYMRELIAPLGAAVEGHSSAGSAGGGKRCYCTVRQEDNRLSFSVHDE